MIHQMLRATVEAVPDADAIVYLDRRISYRELYRNVCVGSEGLRRLGVGVGGTVLLAVRNCPEFVFVYFSTAILRAKVYAIDPDASDPEVRRCLRDARARVVVTDSAQGPRFERLLAERPDLNALIVVVGGDSSGHIAAGDLFAATGPAALAGNGFSEPHPGDWSYTYSSGSTGSPKLICRTQSNQVAEADNITVTARIGPDDRLLCVVPLFHALGQFCCMIVAARSGAALVLLEQSGTVPDSGSRQLVLGGRVDRVLDLIARQRVTIMPAVPYVYDLLADVDPASAVDVSHVRMFLCGANFLPSATAERFLHRYGKPIRQTYGSSEAGSVAWDCRDPDVAVAGSVGHPLRGVDVRVVDRDSRPLGPGLPGEIAVSGPSVMAGYVGRPDLNAEVFADGFYLTGDLGILGEDGRLYVTGRANLLIDTGGHKVNPLEVESVLAEHPRVSDSLVGGAGGRSGDQVLVALIVPSGPVTADELVDFCRERLADYKVPQQIALREGLPRSPLGKLLRRSPELDQAFADAAQAPAATAAPAASAAEAAASSGGPATGPVSGVAAYLVDRLAHLMRIPPETIDVTAPILATGINSLIAMQLRLALERDLGRRVSAGQLLSGASLAKVAADLSAPSVDPGQGSEGFPLCAAQLAYRPDGPDREQPRSHRHNVAAELDGPMDPAALRAAFQELAVRHPMLRVRIDEVGNEAVQRIEPDATIDFVAIPVPAGRLGDQLTALAAQPVAVDQAGPVRVRLLQEDGRPPVLMVSAHRVAVDRWSLAVLFRDLTMMAGSGGEQPDLYLPPLSQTYQQFVELSLRERPADGARRGGEPQHAAGAEVPVSGAALVLDPELTLAVGEVARTVGKSPSTILLALLVAALDGDGPILVAAAEWGRDRPEFSDVVGRFAHDVEALVTLAPEASLVRAVSDVDAALHSGDRTVHSGPAVAARSRSEEITSLRFVDEVLPRPDLLPLLRFVSGGPAEAVPVGDRLLRAIPLPGPAARHAIVARLTHAESRYTLMWQRDPARVSAPQLEMLVARFAHLLRDAVTRPTEPLVRRLP